jgi:peptidylamidoglycolate lyase
MKYFGMNRRDFIIDISILGFATLVDWDNQVVFGHNQKKYTWDRSWNADHQSLPMKDAHEMVFTSDSRIALLTNETKNNLIFFDKKGKITGHWGNYFSGGHGLTLAGQGTDQSLFITDTDLHQFFETTLDGKIIRTWDVPLETGKYNNSKEFVPTETAVTSDGEIYVADGYGAQFITHYGADGKIKNIFGGRGEGDAFLDNAHGICVDTRSTPHTLIITDRTRCCFKRYSMTGEYLSSIHLPGANVCRPVIKGDYLYAAVLTSSLAAETGFVVILDKADQLNSCIGGSTPSYKDGKAALSYQTIQLFKHPHDVMIDDEDNLYVSQWNSGNVYPYKFTPWKG